MEEVLRQLPTESTQQAAGYPSLFLLVALGSLVPVVPTGALVSSAAVVAFHQTSPVALLVVFAVASGAARLLIASSQREPFFDRTPRCPSQYRHRSPRKAAPDATANTTSRANGDVWCSVTTVSYTHLTLPTN